MPLPEVRLHRLRLPLKATPMFRVGAVEPVLAGGIGHRHARWAARAHGCDLACMEMGFIAPHESLARPACKDRLARRRRDDVPLTSTVTGLQAERR